jgi:hypothetical protein
MLTKMKKENATTRTESVQVIENKSVSSAKLEKVLLTLIESLPMDGESVPLKVTNGNAGLCVSSVVGGKLVSFSISNLKGRRAAL